MGNNQVRSSFQTLNVASNDQRLKTSVENWCKKNNKKLILSEPNSPDLIAINSFAIIADPEFVGTENMISFVEFQKAIKFNESIYEDAELVNFYKQYFDWDDNGKFIQEPTELLLTNKFNANEIISKLDEFIN
jgi:hypothetical protein